MKSLQAALLCCLAVSSLAIKTQEVEIVLARCREDISWVDQMKYGDITTVYSKCGVMDGPGRHVEMANVGREGGTYLQHIVDRYDTLADWTVFSQAGEPTYGYRGHRLGGGHMMSNVKFSDYVDAAKTRMEIPRFFMYTTVLMMKDQKIYQNIRRGYGEEYTKPSTDNHELKMCGAPEDWTQWVEFPDWFTGLVTRLQEFQNAPFHGFGLSDTLRLFDIWPTNGVTFFAQGARFGISREAIQMRPKSYYENLLPFFNHPDPWAGYFLEWLWWYVLAGQDAPCHFESSIVEGFEKFVEAPKMRPVVVQQVSGNSTLDCLLPGAPPCPTQITADETLTVTTTAPLVLSGLTVEAAIVIDAPPAPITITGTSFTNCKINDFTSSELTMQAVSLSAHLTSNGPALFNGDINVMSCGHLRIFGNLDHSANSKISLAVGTMLDIFNGVTDVSTSTCSGEGQVYLRNSQFKRRGVNKWACDLVTGSVNTGLNTKFQRLATGSTVDICGPLSADITINAGDTFILNLMCTTAEGGNMVQSGSLNLNSGSAVQVACASSSYTPPSTNKFVVSGTAIPLTLACTVPTTDFQWTLITYGAATASSGAFAVAGCASGCSCVATVGATALIVKQTCSSASSSGDSGSSSDSGVIIGAVVGSVVGAAVLAACLGTLAYFYWRRGVETVPPSYDPFTMPYQNPTHMYQHNAKVPADAPMAYW